MDTSSNISTINFNTTNWKNYWIVTLIILFIAIAVIIVVALMYAHKSRTCNLPRTSIGPLIPLIFPPNPTPNSNPTLIPTQNQTLNPKLYNPGSF